jgi:hypothetical protein
MEADTGGSVQTPHPKHKAAKKKQAPHGGKQSAKTGRKKKK